MQGRWLNHAVKGFLPGPGITAVDALGVATDVYGSRLVEARVRYLVAKSLGE